MGLVRTLARPMLASIFVVEGARALLEPEKKAAEAKDVTDAVKDAAGEVDHEAASTVRDASAEQLVQANGAAQLVGGLLLATGRMPRLAAALVAGSLVPTTVAGHPFWEADDPQERAEQRLGFLKNVSLLGGLLITSMDTAGKPGLPWRASHATDHAKLAAEHAAELAGLRKELAAEKARRLGDRARHAAAVDPADHLRVRKELATTKARAAASVDPSEHLRVRKELTKKRLTPDVKDAKRLVSAVRSDD